MTHHCSFTFSWYGWSTWSLFHTSGKHQRRYGVNLGRLAIRFNWGTP